MGYEELVNIRFLIFIFCDKYTISKKEIVYLSQKLLIRRKWIDKNRLK